MVGVVCNLISQVGATGGGMDSGSAMTLSFVAMGSVIAADALWMTSVINAAQYTRKVAESSRRSSLSLYPVYSVKTGGVGLGMQLHF